MELVIKMNVPAQYLYETIIKSVLTDIHSQTGKKLTEKQLKGFEYVKTFSKQAKATICIEEVIQNKSYQYRTSTTKNSFFTTYDIQPLTEESCELHYTENIQSYGFLQQTNDALVGIFWSRLKKRKFKEMLRQIEASYDNKEKELVTRE